MTTYQLPMFSISRIREEASIAIETSPGAVSTASAIISFVNQVVDAFIARCSAAQLDKLDKRIERARLLAESGTSVLFTEDPRVFKVRSSSRKGEFYYNVNVASKYCNCPDHAEHGCICKHILAAYFTKKAYEQDPTRPDSQPHPKPEPSTHQITRMKFPSEIEKAIASLALFEPVVYAMLTYGNLRIPVQILAADAKNRLAHIQALPGLNSQGELIPSFPFPSGPGSNCVMYSTTDVSFDNLSNVRVYDVNRKNKKGE